MWHASYRPAGSGTDREVSAATEAELRVVLRVIDRAGGLDSGTAFNPDGHTVARWSSEGGCWVAPDGEPWGVE